MKIYRIINNQIIEPGELIIKFSSILHTVRELRRSFPVYQYHKDCRAMYFTDYEQSNGYYIQD